MLFSQMLIPVVSKFTAEPITVTVAVNINNPIGIDFTNSGNLQIGLLSIFNIHNKAIAIIGGIQVPQAFKNVAPAGHIVVPNCGNSHAITTR